MSNQEQAFIQQALARVEKAEKYNRIKHWILKAFGMGAVLLWAIHTPGPEVSAQWVVLIGVAVIVMAGTTKILATVNGNTKAILQAVTAMRSNDTPHDPS